MKMVMKMEYLLSVDAGGSKTIALLATLDLKPIRILKSGPMNIVENGEKVVCKNLRKFKKLFENLPKGSVVHSCFGMPALGEFDNSEERLKSIITKEIGIQPEILVNDVVVGWAAGTLGRDGVHVVAGTGTIAYGRYGSQECRSGGWGSLIGDEGSAYDIGRETIRRVCRQIDGREPETFLKNFIMRRLGLKEWWELSNWIYSKPFPERRPIIAAVAQLTHEAARMGDKAAIEILENAGREIALCAVAVSQKLKLDNPLVSYSGSVLAKNSIVREKFKAVLKELLPNSLVKEATLHPAVGGLILLLQKLTKVQEIVEAKIEQMRLISDFLHEEGEEKDC